VESKWKNYHITTFPGQSLSKTLEEATGLSQDRLILELEHCSVVELLNLTSEAMEFNAAVGMWKRNHNDEDLLQHFS
jgi:hypothetical protein